MTYIEIENLNTFRCLWYKFQIRSFWMRTIFHLGEVGRLGSEVIDMSEQNIKGSLDGILLKENLIKLEEQVYLMNQEKKEDEETMKTLQDQVQELDKQIEDIAEEKSELSHEIEQLREENERNNEKLEKAWNERNSSGENAGMTFELMGTKTFFNLPLRLLILELNSIELTSTKYPIANYMGVEIFEIFEISVVFNRCKK